MAFALWRSRSVPRWLAVLFSAGLEVAQQVASIGPVRVVLFMLPFAVATVLLAARIWQAAVRAAGQPRLEPAVVPVSSVRHSRQGRNGHFGVSGGDSGRVIML
jgi:hypothetical protein